MLMRLPLKRSREFAAAAAQADCPIDDRQQEYTSCRKCEIERVAVKPGHNMALALRP